MAENKNNHSLAFRIYVKKKERVNKECKLSILNNKS